MGHPFNAHRGALTGIAALLVALGCKVGPTFTPPAPPKLAEYGATPLPGATEGDAQRFLKGQAVPAAWWTTFGSPELNRRVELALAHSPTMASAQAAVRRAREDVAVAGGAQYPSLDAQVGVSRTLPGVALGFFTPFTIYAATLNVSYTLDLFGGTRRRVEGLQAQADLRQWQLTGTYLSLTSNVTIATVQEASLGEQLQAAQAVVTLLEEQTALTGRQVEIGVKSQGDLLALQAQLAAARAALPPLAQQLEAVRNQLAVYLGGYTSETKLEPVALGGLTLPKDLPVSLPSQVVQRRPDIQAAQAQLHAATAQVGVATAALLPQLTLGGSYGPQALSNQNLFQPSNETWSLSAGLLQPLFHGGALRAQKRGAEAGLDQALADYRQTVLVAFANVSDALNAVRFDAQSMQAQVESERAAARSLELARAQYRIGAASYLQLLDATRSWQLARMGLIRARAASLSDTTALYAALGGGF
ncbi:MAG: efflux transporter outer membrane subunit [Geothrix sp.]|nr:efflux transporter outer membrane subunit [Geothrix sp.]